MARALSEDLGVKTRLVFTDFGRFMDDIESDRCDIGMFGIGRTKSRLARLDFSQPYMASGMYGITTKTHQQITSWESIDRPDIVVCVQKGTYMESAMRNTLKHAEISVVNRPYEREAGSSLRSCGCIYYRLSIRPESTEELRLGTLADAAITKRRQISVRLCRCQRTT